MKNRNWFWGIFFLLSAVFVILSQTWLFHEISVMSILATVFLAALIIDSLLRLHFFGIFIPLSFLYMIYSKPFNLMYISPWLLISSAVLISISFNLLFPKRQKKAVLLNDQISQVRENIDENNPYVKENLNDKNNPYVKVNLNDENNPYVKVNLNSTSKYIHSECLQGGYFASYLGVLDVYFDHAELSPDGAEVFIDCNLGTINLFIPKEWNVVDNTSSYLGSLNYKHEHNKLSKDVPLLTLVGKVTLGEVNIYYI